MDKSAGPSARIISSLCNCFLCSLYNTCYTPYITRSQYIIYKNYKQIINKKSSRSVISDNDKAGTSTSIFSTLFHFSLPPVFFIQCAVDLSVGHHLLSPELQGFHRDGYFLQVFLDHSISLSCCLCTALRDASISRVILDRSFTWISGTYCWPIGHSFAQ